VIGCDARPVNRYQQKSFWLSGFELAPGRRLTGEVSCNVAIVGGGFTGIATAYFLKKLDPAIEVAVIEKEVVGYGASGRNAGFCTRFFGLEPSVTALRFGRENALKADQFTGEAVELVRQLVEEHSIACDYEPVGALLVATSPAHEVRVRKYVEFAHRMGLGDIRWLDSQELAEEVRSPLFRGAASDPTAAMLNPANLVRGMKSVVEGMGVHIYEDTPVLDVKAGDGVTLRVPEGVVRADRVVFATNAYTHLLPLARRKQLPGFTHIVLTEPLRAEHFEQIGWQNRQGLSDARNLIHYFRLTADNRVLFGGSDIKFSFGKGMDLDDSKDVFSRLERDLHALFPALADLQITHRWGGPVSITLDMAPAVGRAAKGRVLYAVGCMGQGVSLSHLNGKTLAEMALGKQTPRTEMFFVDRFVPPVPPEPFRYALCQTARGLLRLQDRLTD
jgi:glycine/D-amino acid oxidase-like deaminating enzyme